MAKKQINIEIGERLRKARKNLGLEQSQIAERINVKDYVIRDYELGASGISAELLQFLSGELGISLDWLHTGEGEMYAAPKETKDTQSHNTPQARERWALVREWLTITGTITEWYFLVQSHCDGVTLNDLLAVEAGEIDPPPSLVLWILSSGVSIDWLIGIPEAPPFSDSEEGRNLEAKLRARYTKRTAPVEELLLV